MCPSRPARQAGLAGMTVTLLAGAALAAPCALAGGPVTEAESQVQPSSEAPAAETGADVSLTFAAVQPAVLEGVDGAPDSAGPEDFTQPAAGPTVTLSLAGFYDTTGARALLERINQIRAEAAAEGITVDGEVVSGVPLEWSPELETLAQKRAAETSFSFSHERPDGSGRLTALGGNGLGIEVLDENLALVENTAAAIEGWYAEKDAYLEYLATGLDTGNFARYVTLISDDYLYMGAASFTVDASYEVDVEDPTVSLERSRAAEVLAQDESVRTIAGMGYVAGTVGTGSTAVVALFSATPSAEANPLPDGDALVPIGVATDYIAGSVSGPATMFAGEDAACVASAIVGADPWGGSTAIQGDVVSSLSLSWASSDEAVATVDDQGVVHAIAPGAVRISAHAGDVELGGFDLLVEAAPAVAVETGMLPVVTTERGVAPELPADVEVSWSDGRTSVETIAWDPVDSSLYAEPGSFSVCGAAGDSGLVVECVVEVSMPTVVLVEPLPAVSVPAGSMPELPATVAVSMSDGTVAELDVVWDEPAAGVFDAHEGATVVLSGSVEGWPEPLELVIEVEPAQAVSAVAPEAISTQVGVVPALPATVEVLWSDGVTTEETVAWEQPTGEGYAQAGTLEVHGTTEPSGLEVSCQVIVGEPKLVSVADPEPLTTPSGTAPELPASLEAMLSNGAAASVSVVWDTIDPAAYRAREGGSFEVAGSVDGWDEPVRLLVTVEPAVVVGCEALPAVITPSGIAPTLPEDVTATWSNGDAAELPVAWEAFEAEAYSALKGGAFEVRGTVEGWDEPIVLQVQVQAADPLQVAQLPDITTEELVAPELPSLAEVTWSNGDVTSEPVVWEELDSSNYAQAGSFEVAGMVDVDAPDGLAVNCLVNVLEPTVVSVQPLEGVETPSGTAPVLPENVVAVMSNGSSSELSLSWDAVDEAAYSAREGGSLMATGAAEGWADPVSVEVKVLPAVIEGVDAIEGVTTVEGVAPILPGAVGVAWSNGERDEATILWGALDPEAYGQPGAFEAQGFIEGWNQPLTCPVVVETKSAVATAQLQTVQTEAGVAPELPATVGVEWNNGTASDEAVTWDAVDQASYHDGGTFTVAGTVEAAGVAVEVAVEVADAHGISCAVVSADTPAGVVPVLPDMLEVQWSNGDVTQESVEWSLPEEAAWLAMGKVTVDGSFENASVGLGARAEVTVSEPVVVALSSLDAVDTTAGVAPVLPSEVSATLSDGTQAALPVTWPEVAADRYHMPGMFVLEGVADGFDGSVSLTVVVGDPLVRSIEVVEVTTEQRKAPQLPDAVRIVWDNGEETLEPVTWSEVKPMRYSWPGTFTVNGVAAGYDVQAVVSVLEVPAADDTSQEDIAPTGDKQDPALATGLAAFGSMLVAVAVALARRIRRDM